MYYKAAEAFGYALKDLALGFINTESYDIRKFVRKKETLELLISEGLARRSSEKVLITHPSMLHYISARYLVGETIRQTIVPDDYVYEHIIDKLNFISEEHEESVLKFYTMITLVEEYEKVLNSIIGSASRVYTKDK